MTETPNMRDRLSELAAAGTRFWSYVPDKSGVAWNLVHRDGSRATTERLACRSLFPEDALRNAEDVHPELVFERVARRDMTDAYIATERS